MDTSFNLQLVWVGNKPNKRNVIINNTVFQFI